MSLFAAYRMYRITQETWVCNIIIDMHIILTASSLLTGTIHSLHGSLSFHSPHLRAVAARTMYTLHIHSRNHSFNSLLYLCSLIQNKVISCNMEVELCWLSHWANLEESNRTLSTDLYNCAPIYTCRLLQIAGHRFVVVRGLILSSSK